jgi:class 3 adenylate cyclase
MSEERRLVTILFADVVGSTALGESLDPEDVRALLGRLFAIARDAVDQHGGRLEKFIGDAIMAVFGLPIAHDDDAARALSAALDLRDRVRADPALADRIAIRLGVNGGDVIATRDPQATEFMVTGDPVNTAARLQQSAEPWGILVGERTVRAVGEHFSFGPPIAIDAKGKANLVAARPLLGPAKPDTRQSRHRIVGREADLQQLDLTARRSFEERRPFLVSIVAPAGVGKSRLLEEFLDGLDHQAQIAIAQCLPYGQRLTYYPMRAILLSLLDLPDEANPEKVRETLEAWFRNTGEPDPERTIEQLAATVGAGEIETVDRVSLFGAWRRFVELAAERSPVVLVIEDLHWSSDSLLDLVESMLQPRGDVPLLMIALARPELLDRRPSWGGGRRNGVSISLEPLPERAVAELVADLLDRPAPEIVAAVVARAEGNPFYAGEIVRSLVDRLGKKPDPDAVAGAIASLPDTVHATVLARLDALEPGARRVVQLGSVFGRSFQPRALPELEAGLTESEAEAAVDALLERDLIRPSGLGVVTFRHILIREVAYGTLTRSDRARLHAAAGTWLENEATSSGREDELAELVAFHLREAATLGSLLGEAPGPDLSVRAVRWLRLAAESAAAGAASQEAARHLNAAIELAPIELQPDLYERLGEIWAGGDQGVEAFDRALALGSQLGLGPEQELRTLAQAVIVASRWAGSVGKRQPREEKERRFERLRELVAQPFSDRALLLGHLGLAFGPAQVDAEPDPTVLGPARESDPTVLGPAREHARTALQLARGMDDADFMSAALDALGAISLTEDRPASVFPFTSERLALGDRLATNERVDARIVTAWAKALLGDLEGAQQAAAEARAGLGSGQAASWALGASAWRALALQGLGRWDEAMVELQRAVISWQESEIRAPWYALNGFLAGLAISRARVDPIGVDQWRTAANTVFERSDPTIRTQRLRAYVDEDLPELERLAVSEFRTFTGRLDYVYLACQLLADRRHPAPAAKLDEVIAYMEERSLTLVSSAARRLRGLVARDATDLTIALAAFEAMGARPGVARTRTELGLLAGDAGLIEQGLDELERLGDLEQMARVAAERQPASERQPEGEGQPIADRQPSGERRPEDAPKPATQAGPSQAGPTQGPA